MADRPFPLRFELPGPARHIRVERVQEELGKRFGYPTVLTTLAQGHWRLWLMANADWTLGTFLQLLDDGTINRVTWHEDGSESIFEVKGMTDD